MHSIDNERFHTKDLVMDNHSAECIFNICFECAVKHDISTALVYTDSKLIEDSIHKGSVK